LIPPVDKLHRKLEMSEQKGPKIDLPDELAAELDEQPAEDAQESGDPEAAAEQVSVEAAGEAAPEAEAAAEPSEDEEAPEATPEEQLAALNDRYLRLGADFENFKRRMLKERQELLNYGSESLIKELLPTVDNLERALGYAVAEEEEAIDKDNLAEGVELTFRSLMQTLEKAGVEVIAPEGEEFDPRHHEAMRQIPSAEHPPGTVIEVYQKGYLLRQRLLRPALVAVSSAAENDSNDD
jgi:molecular chaperone GrpE